MTSVTQQYWAPADTQHFVNLGKRLGNALVAVGRWRQRNRAIRELSKLSDWQLQDIGLTHGATMEARPRIGGALIGAATIMAICLALLNVTG